MKVTDRKIFLATLAAIILPNFHCVKVFAVTNPSVFVFNGDNPNASKSSVVLSNNFDIDKSKFTGSQFEISGGDFSKIYVDLTAAGNISNNRLYISGGKIGNGLYGGLSSSGSVVGNTINIQGGEISGDVIAGKVKLPNSKSVVANNVINIHGSPDLSRANLSGGILGKSSGGEGNILNINTSGLTIGNINSDSFDKIYVKLPSTVQNGETVLNILSGDLDTEKFVFTVEGNADFNVVWNKSSNAGGTTSVTIHFNEDNKGTKSNVTAIVNNASKVTSKTLLQTAEVSTTVSTPISQTWNSDFVKAIIPELDPFTEMMTDVELYREERLKGEKIFSEEDFIELNEYKFFYNSGKKNVSTKSGGGYIKTSGDSYALGFTRSFKTDFGKIFVAPVFESASGDYNAALSGNVFGIGKIKYSAGGIVGRLTKESGLYYEGSFRAGRTENSFSSNDFVIGKIPSYMTYSTEAPIFTGHLRIGNAIKLDDKNILDLYGIYFATRQNGNSATLSTGEHVRFNSAFAQTFRLGYRLTTRTSKISKIYSGFAWQYEKNSDSIVSAENYIQKSDGASGSSGMFEFGWQIKPNKFTTWTIDLNACGWFGRQQGFNVTMQAQKSF